MASARPLAAVVAPLRARAVRDIVLAISVSCGEVAALARAGGAARAGTRNQFGDAQLELDLGAERVILERLQAVRAVAAVASEERPEGRELHADGTHCVTFDPLDGSSIVACNWAVGSIFGVWEGSSVLGLTGESLVASVVCVYGPRCAMWLAMRGSDGVVELTHTADGWVQTDFVNAMDEGVHVFAPANLRCAQDNAGYEQLVQYYMRNRYTLRYSGGLVPDVCQLLTRRGGVFVSPVSERAKAKLRVLYEVMPIAHVVESGGGVAVDERGRRVLEHRVQGYDERMGLCCGEKSHVQQFIEMVVDGGA